MAADEDPLRRRLWIKGKAREHALQSENNKSARATLILDLMESFHAVASYATVMDVWKALAVGGLGEDEGRRRPEALEVVRTTRQRRVEVYRLDTGAAGGGAPRTWGASAGASSSRGGSCP
jgi:hypothetical protein